MVVTADCVPVALVRIGGRPGGRARARRLARPAGRCRARRRRRARRQAVTWPPRSGRPSGRAVTRSVPRWPSLFARRSGPTSSATAGSTCRLPVERALGNAGCVRVDRLDECTGCHPERYFSHRRDDGAHRTAGGDCLYRLTRFANATSELVAEVGPDVTVVAATKYVPLDEMGVLAEAGMPVVGENRAQDLEAKHEPLGDAFRWHFIGHLQSRKAGTVNAPCELVPLARLESAARRLEIPALVQVNLAGEETKSGVAPARAGAVPGRLSGRDRRALDHAAAR